VRATSSGHPPPLVAAWVEGALEKLQAQMSWIVVDRALQETMATNLASNQHVSDAWQMPMMFADGFFLFRMCNPLSLILNPPPPTSGSFYY